MAAPLDRRSFLRAAAASVAGLALARHAAGRARAQPPTVLDAVSERPDSLDLGPGWETLNPGGWAIRDGALTRRLRNRGDRARNVDHPSWSFPYHWETHGGEPMRTEYDPSLPPFLVHRRDWRLERGFELDLVFVVGQHAPMVAGRGVPDGDDPAWAMHQPGYGMFGLCFGASSQLESFGKGRRAVLVAWRDDGSFGLFRHKAGADELVAEVEPVRTPVYPSGTRLQLTLTVSSEGRVAARLREVGEGGVAIDPVQLDPTEIFPAHIGLVGRGLLGASVETLSLHAKGQRSLDAPRNELHLALPLGDTLRRAARADGTPGPWTVRMVCVFQGEGQRAEVRVATSPDPAGGWESVPVAGAADIVTHDFRQHTALVDVALPAAPNEHTLHYTVWKDGVDVTADPRVGTDAVGPGTGFVPGVPARGDYVGRLPRLRAPYGVCGLSCHAIHGGHAQLEGAGDAGPYQVHDQPTEGAFQHLEEFDDQILLWEDDVWYLELYLFPPSTDDAYKIITLTMGGPTTRWQCMRHWNVLNPGDHDFGMDDVKGPEQLAVRNRDGLGQDREYLARNFQIVQHLMQGLDDPSATDNPERWRRWRLPDGDLALLVCDGRLWRSSQDTALWDDEGWDAETVGTRSIHDRTDPTRALLGEAQFAWLTETLRSEPSELVLLTGLNGLHTIWDGVQVDPDTGGGLANRDRVGADYAGWVKAGADRVLELLAERPGVVSVYGDVHVGSLVENDALGVIECSFGPIGRHGGREPKDGFGPRMVDHDGRPLTVHALYHQQYGAPDLSPREGPRYWNVLQARLDPRAGPDVELTIRNLVDGPHDAPRGGGAFARRLDDVPRQASAVTEPFETLPRADVFLRTTGGRTVRGCRSDASGRVRAQRLVGVRPGERLLALADDGVDTRAHALRATAPG